MLTDRGPADGLANIRPRDLRASDPPAAAVPDAADQQQDEKDDQKECEHGTTLPDTARIQTETLSTTKYS